MRFLSLFAGIGGFDLGLERAGMTCVGQCEIEPYCRAVLRKHWPDVPIFDDIRQLTIDAVQQTCGTVDLVCGGVPCQPSSVAGKRLGAKDDRWLWPEFLRIVRGVRPRWVVAENVPGLLALGDESEAVFRDLEQAGYTVWPLVVGADDVGAPHRRKRLWIVAYCGREQWRARWTTGPRTSAGTWQDGDNQRCGETLVYPERDGRRVDQPGRGRPDRRTVVGGTGETARLAGSDQPGPPEHPRLASDAGPQCTAAIGSRWPARPGERQHEWEMPRLVEFPMDGDLDGVPVRLARFSNRNALKAIGNAVVPACVEAIGRAIMQIG